MFGVHDTIQTNIISTSLHIQVKPDMFLLLYVQFPDAMSNAFLSTVELSSKANHI